LQEPEKLEVEKKSGRKKKERHPNAHKNPPDMLRNELILMVAKLQEKVCDQNILIKELKKCLKHGGDDGEGGKTYKQLYESQNNEFQEMTQERNRVTGINEQLQKDIQILKTAAAQAENEKALFKRDFESRGEMLKKVEEFNKELTNYVFGNRNRSTYAGAGGAGSMSARVPSPNENGAYNFISPM